MSISKNFFSCILFGIIVIVCLAACGFCDEVHSDYENYTCDYYNSEYIDNDYYDCEQLTQALSPSLRINPHLADVELVLLGIEHNRVQWKLVNDSEFGLGTGFMTHLDFLCRGEWYVVDFNQWLVFAPSSTAIPPGSCGTTLPMQMTISYHSFAPFPRAELFRLRMTIYVSDWGMTENCPPIVYTYPHDLVLEFEFHLPDELFEAWEDGRHLRPPFRNREYLNPHCEYSLIYDM